ncbi:hypothetical protein K1719_020869 [Acacia pycnantha]|nr:hypothetical protein K1719_020869 [Acacia pycnantha]
MITLAIFSKDYASSKRCLEELVKIIERKEANQQIVILVFYGVDPSDVRHQKGTYAKATLHDEEKFKDKLLGQKDHIDANNALKRSQWKKVLIALDDMDNPKQLKDLVGRLQLGPGRRVIVTSRDKHVLRSGGIHDQFIHEVNELSLEESLELFSIHAFNESHAKMRYQELSKMTMAIAKGIPLALEVLGSHFHSRDKAYWESEIYDVLKSNMGTYEIEDLLSDLDSFSNKLRYLHWDHYPLGTLPSGFYHENLVELHMQNNNVKKLWDGNQDLGNLKTINLRRSKQLIELSDLSLAHKLESVYLQGSVSIDELCCLTNLEVFWVTHLKQVIDIKQLHSLFYAWRNLRELRLEGKNYFSEIPANIKALTRLECLSLYDSAVETLPTYVNHLSSLKYIYLRRCKRLKSILGLPLFLRMLDACECTLLETLSSESLVRNKCFLNFCNNCEKLDERVAPPYLVSEQLNEVLCYFSYDDNNKFHISRTLFYPALNRDHVLLCPVRRISYDAGIGNESKISCEFFLKYWDEEERAHYEVPAKACGAHLIYYSEPSRNRKMV